VKPYSLIETMLLYEDIWLLAFNVLGWITDDFFGDKKNCGER
jgi:hypothetical protein